MRHVLLAGACLAAGGILLLAPSAQAVGDDTGEEPQHTVIMSNEEFEQLYGHEASEAPELVGGVGFVLPAHGWSAVSFR
ncbi:hypothetical protein OOK13_20540 [Streptomyces sp. NBC_00378]|uniref:hypothetical protein n=1 Tax=unclassified Streptomyces TaxID=2593676 RepID=UPI002251F903|nr:MULTISPECIES: hypothetical protein [unclassified Streptomyces]MCX5110892.1 hypothetical protein [Streptomyces sp. NBC_00378]